MYRLTWIKETKAFLYKCAMPIFYTNWRFLTNAQAKDIAMNYSKALETKLAEGKSVPWHLITATVKLQYNSSYNIHHTSWCSFQNQQTIRYWCWCCIIWCWSGRVGKGSKRKNDSNRIPNKKPFQSFSGMLIHLFFQLCSNISHG